MTKYQVVLSPQSREDIQEIHDFIALDKPIAADRFVVKIIRLINDLDTMPRRYKRLVLPFWSEKDIRTFAVGNYNIYYEIDDRTRKVIIVRVVSAWRSLDRVMRD